MTFSKENIQAASNSIKEAAGENYGKIINHLQKDSVCFISAFNDGLSYNENIERHNELEQIINSLALGYIHIKGEFFEKYSETPCKFQQERSLMVILNYVKKFENEMQQTKEELNAAEEIPESKIQEYEKKLNLLENLKKETGKQFLYIMLALKEKFSQPSIFIRHYIGSGEFDNMYIKNGRAFHLGNAAAVSGLHSFWLNAHKTVFAPPEPINSGGALND